jgi:amidase
MAGFTKSAEYVPFTPAQNITGQPGMSVPLYWTRDGLPLGAHFATKAGGEGLLFRLASQLEEARPWAGRIPPVSA